MSKGQRIDLTKFSSLKGYALVNHLENNPHFLAMLARAKEGWQELPCYLQIRFSRIASEKPQKSKAASF